MATGRLPTFHGRLKVMIEIDNYHINFILVPESVHFSLPLMVKNGLELDYEENLGFYVHMLKNLQNKSNQ